MHKVRKAIEQPLQFYGKRPAVSFFKDGQLETALTYDQLENDIRQFSGFLLKKKINKSDRVVILLEKSLVFVVAHLALLRMGVICVPLNPEFKTDELSYLLKDADPALTIIDTKIEDRVKKIDTKFELLSLSSQKPYTEHSFFRTGDSDFADIEKNPDDPALMIYTSGTTGYPKGALLSYANLNHDAASIIATWKLSQNDVLCHSLPLFHIHGLCFALHTLLLCGGHIIMQDRFDPPQVIHRLSSKDPENKVSVFMAVPTMYIMLMNHLAGRKIDFSHIRLLTSGSAPLREKDFFKIKNVFGKEPVEREGMSETGMNFSNPLPEDGIRKPGSIGLPLKNVRVKIVDPDTGRDVDKGSIGEFRLKSRSIIKGYWKKPEQSREAFDNGWFKTGDLGKVDTNGYYYLTDRLKHLIISGGENVSAKEVEAVIEQIRGVDEAAVVGIHDEKWGEKVVAAVVCKEKSLKPYQIIKICKEKLHQYKCPKQVVFVDRLPRNTMGKVLKECLKQVFQ